MNIFLRGVYFRQSYHQSLYIWATRQMVCHCNYRDSTCLHFTGTPRNRSGEFWQIWATWPTGEGADCFQECCWDSGLCKCGHCEYAPHMETVSLQRDETALQLYQGKPLPLPQFKSQEQRAMISNCCPSLHIFKIHLRTECQLLATSDKWMFSAFSGELPKGKHQEMAQPYCSVAVHV